MMRLIGHAGRQAPASKPQTSSCKWTVPGTQSSCISCAPRTLASAPSLQAGSLSEPRTALRRPCQTNTTIGWPRSRLAVKTPQTCRAPTRGSTIATSLSPSFTKSGDSARSSLMLMPMASLLEQRGPLRRGHGSPGGGGGPAPLLSRYTGRLPELLQHARRFLDLLQHT